VKDITAAELKSRLASRYSRPFYAFFEEVRDATGFNGSRSLDGVALGLYASRGFTLHGFECKISRGDWLQELKDPRKADHGASLVDSWWIVTPPKLVKPGELPARWGLLEANGKGLRCVKEAPIRESETLDRAFAVSIVQRAMKFKVKNEKYTREELEEQVNAARQNGIEIGEANGKREVQNMKQELEIIDAAKKAVGETWLSQSLVHRLALVSVLQDRWKMDRLKEAPGTLRELADDIEKRVAAALQEINTNLGKEKK